MLLTRTWLVPHLPTLLVDQHRRHRTALLDALERVAERLFEEQPAAVVIVSARWDQKGPFLVGSGKRHTTLTDYSGFGVEGRYDCAGSPALARALVDAGQKAGVRVGAATRGVDSGVTVPLHFLLPTRSLPVVPLSLAPASAAECRAWGAVIRRTLTAWPERVAFVVGGLLSHNEHAWSLNRETPEARTFDALALDALVRGAWPELEASDPALREKARPEAELRHLHVLRGVLGDDTPGTVLGYDQVPGIGLALVEFPLAGAPAASPAEAGEG